MTPTVSMPKVSLVKVQDHSPSQVGAVAILGTEILLFALIWGLISLTNKEKRKK